MTLLHHVIDTLRLLIMIVEHHYYREVIAMFMIFFANITIHRYNIF